MGSGEESTPAKSTPAKSSKQTVSTQETPTTPSYPDWSTSMQAYYGAGATPPPFFTSTVASPTPHPYMWGSQHLIPPYGTPLPYPAIYPHGGLYPHPNMAVAQGAALMTTETEGKVPNGKDRVSIKKSKGSSGNTGLVGGKSGESGKAVSGSGNDGASQSVGSGSEDSSEASDENTNQDATKKRSFDQMLADGANAQNNTAQYSGGAIESSFVARGQPATNLPVSMPGKPAVTMPTTNLNIGMDLWNASPAGAVPLKARPNASGVSPAVAPTTMVGREADHSWIQVKNQLVTSTTSRSAFTSRSQTPPSPGYLGRDEREIKKQRRKQSNRESARRSRLRKQAECEELQTKVDALNNENHSLNKELKRLSEECEKLKSENTSIMEELTRLYGTDALDGNHANMLVLQSVNGKSNSHEQDTVKGINSVSGQNQNFFSSNGNLESDPN